MVSFSINGTVTTRIDSNNPSSHAIILLGEYIFRITINGYSSTRQPILKTPVPVLAIASAASRRAKRVSISCLFSFVTRVPFSTANYVFIAKNRAE